MQVSVRTFGVTIGTRSPLAGCFRAHHAPRISVSVRVSATRLRLATIVPIVVEFVVTVVDLAVPIAEFTMRPALGSVPAADPTHRHFRRATR